MNSSASSARREGHAALGMLTRTTWLSVIALAVARRKCWPIRHPSPRLAWVQDADHCFLTRGGRDTILILPFWM
jgi:hypothetical protein